MEDDIIDRYLKNRSHQEESKEYNEGSKEYIQAEELDKSIENLPLNEQISKALILASKNGDLSSIKLLVSMGGTITENCVIFSIIYGQLEVLKYLMTKYPVSFNDRLQDALCIAIINGHFNMINYFISIHNVYSAERENEFLQYAIKYKRLEIVFFLLSYGADINYGIVFSMMYNNTELTKKLLDWKNNHNEGKMLEKNITPTYTPTYTTTSNQNSNFNPASFMAQYDNLFNTYFPPKNNDIEKGDFEEDNDMSSVGKVEEISEVNTEEKDIEKGNLEEGNNTETNLDDII